MKKTKETMLIIVWLSILIIIAICLYCIFVSNRKSYAIAPKEQHDIVKISNAKTINIEEIIKTNSLINSQKEEVFEKQEELEYITKYKYSDEIYAGTTRVAQEGRNGIQTITMKNI